MMSQMATTRVNETLDFVHFNIYRPSQINVDFGCNGLKYLLMTFKDMISLLCQTQIWNIWQFFIIIFKNLKCQTITRLKMWNLIMAMNTNPMNLMIIF